MTPEDTAPAAADAPALLEPIEARILGCLVEKAALTPETYPLTLNATVVACNQKTSRDPVMELEPGAVGNALRHLEDKKIVRVQHASRALRYEHRMDEAFTITPRQRAVLCVLMLRGPQTIAEIFTRTERLAPFPSLDDVRDTLERLIARAPAMVVRFPKGPGQREDRYMHLLCGDAHAQQAARAAGSHASTARDDGDSRPAGGGVRDESASERIAALEARVDALERELRSLQETRHASS